MNSRSLLFQIRLVLKPCLIPVRTCNRYLMLLKLIQSLMAYKSNIASWCQPPLFPNTAQAHTTLACHCTSKRKHCWIAPWSWCGSKDSSNIIGEREMIYCMGCDKKTFIPCRLCFSEVHDGDWLFCVFKLLLSFIEITIWFQTLKLYVCSTIQVLSTCVFFFVSDWPLGCFVFIVQYNNPTVHTSIFCRPGNCPECVACWSGGLRIISTTCQQSVQLLPVSSITYHVVSCHWTTPVEFLS